MISQPETGMSKVAEAKELEEVCNNLIDLCSRAHGLGEILFEFNDRVQGSAPQAGGGETDTPNRLGLIGNIMDHLDSLENALNKIDGQISRANRIG